MKKRWSQVVTAVVFALVISMPAAADAPLAISNITSTSGGTSPSTAIINWATTDPGNTYQCSVTYNNNENVGDDIIYQGKNDVIAIVVGHVIQSPTDNVKNFLWAANLENLAPTTYWYKINCHDNSNRITSEAHSFTVVAAPSQSVTILSPNGGEMYKQGDPITITWSGGKDVVQIVLESIHPAIDG